MDVPLMKLGSTIVTYKSSSIVLADHQLYWTPLQCRQNIQKQGLGDRDMINHIINLTNMVMDVNNEKRSRTIAPEIIYWTRRQYAEIACEDKNMSAHQASSVNVDGAPVRALYACNSKEFCTLSRNVQIIICLLVVKLQARFLM